MDGGGKWAPSMRTSQRSQSLQILRTQASARRERGADPYADPGTPALPQCLQDVSCLSRLDPRALSLAHDRTHLTPRRSIVIMPFLPTMHPYPADPESLFQLIISFNKVLVPIKNSLFNTLHPPSCHLKFCIMSETSLLPILKPRFKREIHREEGSEAPGASLYTRIREPPVRGFLFARHFSLYDNVYM